MKQIKERPYPRGTSEAVQLHLDASPSYEDEIALYEDEVSRRSRREEHWRILAILGVAFGFLGLLYGSINASKPRLLPYVIEVKEDGSARFAGMIRGELTVTDAALRYYFSRFIHDIRSISSDIVALKTDLQDGYSLTRASAAKMLLASVASAKPIEMARNGLRRDISIESFEKLSGKQWRIQWAEETRSDGQVVLVEHKIGIFSWMHEDAKTDAEATANVFGIYITDYFISNYELKAPTGGTAGGTR